MFPCAVIEVSVPYTKPTTLSSKTIFSSSSVCVYRRWELFAPRGLSVHAGRSGHRPGASESPPWCFERDWHRRLQSSLPGRAAPVPGVHPDRTPIHHHGMKIRLHPRQKPFPLLCIKIVIRWQRPELKNTTYVFVRQFCILVLFLWNSSGQNICIHPAYFPTYKILYRMILCKFNPNLHKFLS